MNIQLYTWHGGLNPSRQASASGASAKPEAVQEGSYDRATFQTQESASADDATFARTLAKSAAGRLTETCSPTPERIADLRRQVARRTYEIDSMAIARAMMGL